MKKCDSTNSNDVIYFDYETATKKMFTEGTEPYEYLDKIAEEYGELKEKQELTKMMEFAAKKFKIKNFWTLYRAYKSELEAQSPHLSNVLETNFTGQPLKLKTTWVCNDGGVRKAADLACSHPIMISKRFYNTTTHELKIELSFKVLGRWIKRIIKRTEISTTREIVKLSKYGISVTTQNADDLIRYFQEQEQLNSDIPLIESVTKLGWVNDDIFVPYSSEVLFDGESEFEQLFNSVRSKGSKNTWLEEIRKQRRKHPVVSMVLAGALASPLLDWISALPGFVHIWSGIAGSGKTVLAMIAASCFGNPESGHYLQSFNSTTMAQEKKAGMLKNCPLVLDESQLNTGKYSVYFLAAGQGKARGRADGSLAPVESWCNTIISTGEKPLVTRSDGQGAYARVIEIEVKNVLYDFEDGNYLANFLRENYGHAGPIMVKAMQEIGRESLREKHLEYARLLKRINPDLQEKQIMFGAAILLAEEVATNYIFLDDACEKGLSAEFVAGCLKSDFDSSISQRAYDETIDWIAKNQSKFREHTTSYETYGEEDGNNIYIIRSVFNSFMEENNYSDRAVLSEWSKNNLIETYTEASTGKLRYDQPRRVTDQVARCICLKIVDSAQAVTTLPLN